MAVSAETEVASGRSGQLSRREFLGKFARILLPGFVLGGCGTISVEFRVGQPPAKPQATIIPEQQRPTETPDKHRQDMLTVAREFLNEGYKVIHIRDNLVEFNSAENTTQAVIVATSESLPPDLSAAPTHSQPLTIRNTYQSAADILLKSLIIPSADFNLPIINYDLIPGQPFRQASLVKSPKNLVDLARSIFRIPRLTSLESRDFSQKVPPMTRRFVHGKVVDNKGRSLEISISVDLNASYPPGFEDLSLLPPKIELNIEYPPAKEFLV